jgi:diguanylate cyclase (GGDEF)-like protein
LLLAQKPGPGNLAANNQHHADFITEELDHLLEEERNLTIRIVYIVTWTMCAVFTIAGIQRLIPLWFPLIPIATAINLQILYIKKHYHFAFKFAGTGAFIIFILEFFIISPPNIAIMVEEASIFTILGTLFFRRRFLFYANVASILIFAAGLYTMIFRGHEIPDPYPLIGGGIFVAVVISACWMFMGRSLRLLERLTEAKAALMVDPLTHTYNRAYFDTLLSQMDAISPKGSVSIFIMDIDHFKKVNDTYGHTVGDKVLEHFTKTIRKATRKSDAFIRFGGEEFALVIWHDGTLNLDDYATALLLRVQNHPYEFDTGTVVQVTTSIGGATFIPSEESIHTCLSRADQALYLAKDAGRNQVVLL